MKFHSEAIIGFEWDSGNPTKSKSKHAVSRDEAEQVFFSRPVVVFDAAHSAAENRWRALGAIEAGRLLHVTFTIRATLIRVISARPINRKERRLYETKE